MCMFCAAVPMTVSLGAAARGKLNEKRKIARKGQETVEAPKWMNIPVEKITVALVAALMLCAGLYHVTFLRHIGA